MKDILKVEQFISKTYELSNHEIKSINERLEEDWIIISHSISIPIQDYAGGSKHSTGGTNKARNFFLFGKLKNKGQKI